jgi:hypothetical protein
MNSLLNKIKIIETIELKKIQQYQIAGPGAFAIPYKRT